MPGTATVTGKTGAGLTMTAQVFSNVTAFRVDIDPEVLTIVQGPKTTQIDISAATTFTVVITAPNTYTITVS